MAHGHDVLIETGAGAASVPTTMPISPLARRSPLGQGCVRKVRHDREGQGAAASEWVQLRDGQILYTYLHLAPDPEQTKGLLESGVTAVAYETVTDERGGLPLLAPMSEVAGRLAIQAGATALQKAHGGRGILLGGVPGVLPAKVTVIGGGVVGLHAAKMAVGLGADVTILDRSLPRLRQLDDIFGGRVHTVYSTIDALEQECFSAISSSVRS